MSTVYIIILAALVLFLISLQRTYGAVSVKELKHRARGHDPVAVALLRAAGYGSSLRLLLWTLVVGTAALFFRAVTVATDGWLAVLLSATLLWVGFIWLPKQRATRAGVWLAGKIAPLLDKLLQYLHPLFDRLVSFVRRHRSSFVHTGLYDKDDLLALFDQQKVQADNRVDAQTLEIARHALHFGDKKVVDVMTPRRAVRAVSAEDSIGPLLMSDLHDSGFSRFPVYEGKQDNLVGVLYLRDLLRAKTGGLVQKSMSKTICYVHEDQPLTEALQAILQTHQQLFAVVNTFEEYVGVVTMEDILEEIVGKQIVDEFDQYEDLRAVAAKMAVKEHKEHQKDVIPEDSETITEVVE